MSRRHSDQADEPIWPGAAGERLRAALDVERRPWRVQREVVEDAGEHHRPEPPGFRGRVHRAEAPGPAVDGEDDRRHGPTSAATPTSPAKTVTGGPVTMSRRASIETMLTS